MVQEEEISPTEEQQVEQQDPPTKASNLYKTLVKEGYTKDNIGSENDFVNALKDKTKSDKIYSSLKKDGYSEDNIGKQEDFYNSFQEIKKSEDNIFAFFTSLPFYYVSNWLGYRFSSIC